MSDTISPRDLTQWVVWKYEKREGQDKPTKIPYDPKDPTRRASATDPSTWGSAGDASEAKRAGKFDGVGFVFTEADPFVGIDLDGCMDDEGIPLEWAKEIIDKLDSYTEISPSGTGVHIFIRGELPPDGPFRKGQIEMYDRHRYFTVTGRVLSPREIQDRQAQLEQLRAEVFPPETSTTSGDPHRPPIATVESDDDDRIIELAEAAANGDKFKALWDGSTADYGGDESKADMAFAAMIAFYTGDDHDRIERIINRSVRGQREKWQKRADYRDRTIRRALNNMTDFYTPPSKNKRDGRDGRDGRAVAIIDKEESLPAPKPSAPIFPIDALPQACQQLVDEAVKALGCAAELVALPMLAALSSAIGASRTGYVKRGWEETATLFLAVVASPGSMKSPAAKVAMKPVYKHQDDYKNVYMTKKEEYEKELREYEVDKKDAMKAGEAAPPPPLAPVMKRSIASDTTIEALVGILEDNPRGLVVHRDELTGWVRSMDQYKGGKGSDRQHWLSVWDAQPLVVDRKSRDREPIILTKPFVSLFGGIQPAMLGELGQAMEDGLMDRFLFGYPAISVIRFRWEEISLQAEQRYKALYDGLANLKMGKDPTTDSFYPKPVEFTFQAKRVLADALNDLNEEPTKPGFPGRLEGIWAKMRGYLVRLALIMALCRYVEEEEEEEAIDHQDVLKALMLLEYFKNHARRVYAELQEADPLDLLSGGIKSFLEEEGGSWEGTAEELLDGLSDIGIHGLPANAPHLVKRLLKVKERSPDILVDRKKSGSTRILELKLRNYDPEPDPQKEEVS